MTVNELMERVRQEMTGDAKADLKRISEIAQEYKKEENAGELMEALAQFAVEMLPEDTRRQMEESTFVRGVRMDRAFSNALQMIRESKTAEAEALLSEIASKIQTHFAEGGKKWFSFRNPFEYHMYRLFYPEDTQFDRAPFDFANYLQTYAYVLLNNGRGLAALQMLDRAIAFNPVSVDPRFEQAEIYKLMRMPAKLLEVTRETARLGTAPQVFARTAANMGYYCMLMEQLQDAAVFYFDSLRFVSAPANESELQDTIHRMQLSGTLFAPPSKGQILDVYEKYNVQQPPNSDLVNLALTLAGSAHQHARFELEGLFLRTAYDMTNSDEIREKIEQLEKAIEIMKSEE